MRIANSLLLVCECKGTIFVWNDEIIGRKNERELHFSGFC